MQADNIQTPNAGVGDLEVAAVVEQAGRHVARDGVDEGGHSDVTPSPARAQAVHVGQDVSPAAGYRQRLPQASAS